MTPRHRCSGTALGIPLLTALLVGCSISRAAPLELKSPDGRVRLTFELRDFPDAPGCPAYSVDYHGTLLIAPSRLGLDTEGTPLLGGMTVIGHSRTAHDSTWEPVCGERSSVRNHYRELKVDLARADQPLRRLRLTFRAYNEGVALAYTIPAQINMAGVTIRREQTEFRFTGNHSTWATYSGQGAYDATTLSGVKPGCERPLVVRVDDHHYVALAEARLVDYPRMRLAPAGTIRHALVSQLDGPARTPLPGTTPWRVILVGQSPGQLLESNFLLLNLNDPCAIADTSWIRPGKVIREVTLTTAGGIACVDFAVRNGLQFVEFDAGWYGHEYDDTSDATTITVDPKRSPGPLDLHAVIRYAADRDIGIILYVNRRALEQQLDVILPLYQSWGVRGVKYGFVNVGSQDWTRWLHDAIRLAADHQLMVDIHDEYRPTGFSRTYPNLMTMEGVRGDEARPSAEQTLTYLFTRMLAGPADHTVCYYDRRVDELWSHSFQLAKPVCFFSPWQFLFWYDRPDRAPSDAPGAGGGQPRLALAPELEFFENLPTTWDESRVLQGAIGEYAIIARRQGDAWFVGCMNAGSPREFTLKLDFLHPNRPYQARLYTHDPKVGTPTHVGRHAQRAYATDTFNLTLRANNGAALWLTPTSPTTN